MWTQLCLTAAVAAAMRGEEVVYIDTTGAFSGSRAAAVYQTLQPRVQVQSHDVHKLVVLLLEPGICRLLTARGKCSTRRQTHLFCSTFVGIAGCQVMYGSPEPHSSASGSHSV